MTESEIAHLQKLCEEQNTRLARLNLVLEGYKVMAGLSDPDPIKIQGIIQKQLEEQKGEIRRLKEAHTDCEKPNWTDPELVSQLATQTERARILTEALKNQETQLVLCIENATKQQVEDDGLEDMLREVRQALNQESLGDGK